MENNCIKCNKEIKEKDSYVKLIEYIKGKENRVQYFHLSCYEGLFNIKDIAMTMVKRANKLMSLAGLPEEEKVIEV